MHHILLRVLLALAAGFALSARDAVAGPILMEVCYDGAGADADDVFTEIQGTPGLSLTGYSLRGVNGSDGTVYRTLSLTGLTIPSDGLLVLATSSATGSVLSARDAVLNVDWQNGPDAVQLLDASGSILDALQYGDAGSWNAGEGGVATDVAAGWSLSRDASATDTDDNASDFTGLSTPTPGTGFNVTPVPEPSTLGLVGVGAAALALRRRRRSAA